MPVNLDRQKIAVFVISAMQFDETTPARRCLRNPGTGSEPRIPNAAAETRIVYGGRFGPALSWPRSRYWRRRERCAARSRARMPREARVMKRVLPLSDINITACVRSARQYSDPQFQVGVSRVGSI